MNAENYLNTLFDTARNAELVSSADEIGEGLVQHQLQPAKGSHIFNPKILITMSTVLFLLGGLYFLQPSVNKNPQTESKSVPAQVRKEVHVQQNPIFSNTQRPSGLTDKPIQKSNGITIVNNPDTGTTHNSNTTVKKEESGHVVVPYVPDFMPPGKIEKNRCLTASTQSIDMMNVHLIELTDEELLKLGIELKNKGIVVSTNTKEDGQAFKTTYSKSGSNFNVMIIQVIKTDKTTQVSESRVVDYRILGKDTAIKPTTICENKEVKISVNAGPDQAVTFPKLTTSGLYPEYSLITDDLGQLWRSYKIAYTVNNQENENDPSSKKLNKEEMMERAARVKEKTEQELRAKIAGFVPILVRSGDVNLPDDKAKNLWRADIIIWFEPTEKLFNALPARISDDLRNEYQSVFVKNESSSCKYFETCKNIPGAIETFQVYPNPTEDQMSIEFSLKESRILSASLYQINGEEVKSIFKAQAFEKGSSKHEIHINDLPEGIYLLIVTSNNGDVISKRVIRK